MIQSTLLESKCQWKSLEHRDGADGSRGWERRRPRLPVTIKARVGYTASEDACAPSTEVLSRDRDRFGNTTRAADRTCL